MCLLPSPFWYALATVVLRARSSFAVPSILAAIFLCLSLCANRPVAAQPGADSVSPKPPAIVIGFVGGWVSRNNSVHREVQLAAELRREYSEGVYVQVYENHRAEDAHAEILRLLDTNHDGSLSASEKQNARIIIYGHSWGASETVALARSLGHDGIPVLLTIEVDTVTKYGENPSLIPPNVAQAVNFYQPDGILHGIAEIRAADPSRTQVLGNFRYDYKAKPVNISAYPWLARTLEKTHIEIESDPRVWDQIESMIRSKLSVESQANASVAATTSPR